MGRAFDATASYQAFLVQLALLTLSSAGLMLLMPTYARKPEGARCCRR